MATYKPKLKELMQKHMPRTYQSLKTWTIPGMRNRLAGWIFPDEGRQQLENQVRGLIVESNRRLVHSLWTALQLERTQLRTKDLGGQEMAPRPDYTETVTSPEDWGLARAIAIIEESTKK